MHGINFVNPRVASQLKMDSSRTLLEFSLVDDSTPMALWIYACEH